MKLHAELLPEDVTDEGGNAFQSLNRNEAPTLTAAILAGHAATVDRVRRLVAESA